RPRRRHLLGPLDQGPLELAAQVALEGLDLLALERRCLRIVARPRLEAQRAADPLHVDPDDARALALAAEGGDREARRVAHLAVRPPGDRRPDRLAQLVQVETLTAVVAALLP